MHSLPTLRSRITVPRSSCDEQQQKSLSTLDSMMVVLPPPSEELAAPIEEPAESLPMPLEFLPAQLEPLLVEEGSKEMQKEDMQTTKDVDTTSPCSADVTSPRDTIGRSLAIFTACCVHQEDPCLNSAFMACGWQPAPAINDAAPRQLNRVNVEEDKRKLKCVTAANSRKWWPGKYCLSLLWACPAGAILLVLFYMVKPQIHMRDAVDLGNSVNSSDADSTDTVTAKTTDRCNVTSDSQQRQHNQSWWCKECGFGCDRATATTTPEIQWDCSSDYDSWQQSWSSKKKHWCCQHSHRGCSSGPLTGQLVSTTNIVLPHRSPPTEMPSVPLVSTTSMLLPHRSLPTEMPSLTVAVAPIGIGPCEVLCSLQGHSSSCKGHVGWAVSHWFQGRPDACIRAHTALVRVCPGCSSCTLDALNCSLPAGLRR